MAPIWVLLADDVEVTDIFNSDFGVDEWHGTNAFIQDGDDVFRHLLPQ